MTEPERSLESRFASLEDASRTLTESVSELTVTLMVVADLQRALADQSERQLVTEQEVAKARQLNDERDARTRTVVRLVGLGFGVLIPVVTIVVYASVINHVNDLLAQQRTNSFANCTLRNNAALENVHREQELARLESRPEIRQVHSESALSLAKGLVDCSYLKVTPR